MMKRNFIPQYFNRFWALSIIFLLCFSSVFAQESPQKRKREAARFASEAKKALSDNDFPKAEAKYRQAIAKDPENADLRYNLGNMYYTKEKSGEASERLAQSSSISKQKALRHDAYHNQGNAYMKQKQYEKAVASYENALRNDPTDDQTRYNLALAKKMLEQKNKNKKKNNKNKDKNKDQNKKNKDQKNKNNKDKNKNGKDKKDNKDKQKNKDNQDKNKSDKNKDKKGDQNKDKGKQDDQKQKQPQQKNGDKKNADQQKQPQAVKGKMSPQQMKNLLEAMENQEKKIQDKINARKAKGQKTTTEKDW